jgi:DnaJ-class molecular chaperone
LTVTEFVDRRIREKPNRRKEGKACRPCPRCGGSGEDPANEPMMLEVDCRLCGGSGVVASKRPGKEWQ